MVHLPGGLQLGLDSSAPLDPGPAWPACRPGSYWRAVASPMVRKPYRYGQELGLCLQAVPAPRTPEEALAHVRVVYIDADNRFHWKGEYASDFPRFVHLDEADLAAWRAFLATERVQAHLLRTIAKCRELADRAERYRRAADAPVGRVGGA